MTMILSRKAASVRQINAPRTRPAPALCDGSDGQVLADIGAKAASARAACTAAIDHVGSDPASINECADLIAAARCLLVQIEQLAAAAEIRAVE